jgi:peptide/nickel transport system substrate-binding protein
MRDGTSRGPARGDEVQRQAVTYTRGAFLKSSIGGAVTLSSAGLLLQGCLDGGGETATRAGGQPPSRPAGAMTWGLAQKPASLDPARAIGTEPYTINQNVYEGLTLWREKPTKLSPALATSWEVNDDATEWIFKLRRGVTFHDGEPLTSEAVRLSFDHYRKGKGSFLGSYAGEYTEIDDSDPATVVIRYEKPFPDLARNAPILGIISPKALVGSRDERSRRLEQKSYGAGAFRFDAPLRGNAFATTAFPDYWGKGPYLEEIDGRVVPEESARVAALQAGDLDFLLQVTPLPFSRLERDDRFSVSTGVTWLQNRLIFACDRPPFTDHRARQAVAYAIDRQVIIDALFRGQGKVGAGLMPSGCYGYTEPELQFSLDPDKARELWEAAGGGSREITVAYFATDPPTIVREAEAIVGQLRDVGFGARTVAMNPTEGGDELHGESRKYDILLVQFGWINGGPFFYTPGIFADTQSARYTGRDILDLQERQNSTADGPERLALLEELQNVAQEQSFVLPIAEMNGLDVFDGELQGYTTARNGFMYRFTTMYRA